MTDADKVMNPQHFGINQADIRIWINPPIRIGIPDHFWLKFWCCRRLLFCCERSSISTVWLTNKVLPTGRCSSSSWSWETRSLMRPVRASRRRSTRLLQLRWNQPNCLVRLRSGCPWMLLFLFPVSVSLCCTVLTTSNSSQTSCAARWPPQYAPAPADLDFWPFDLDVGVGVACDLGYPCKVSSS